MVSSTAIPMATGATTLVAILKSILSHPIRANMSRMGNRFGIMAMTPTLNDLKSANMIMEMTDAAIPKPSNTPCEMVCEEMAYSMGSPVTWQEALGGNNLEHCRLINSLSFSRGAEPVEVDINDILAIR